MAEVPPAGQTNQPVAGHAVWQLLKRLSWIALVGAVLWFVLRDLRPGLATLGDGAVMPLIGIAGLFLGAMLVGAKLARAPAGRRPSFNDMLALLVAPACALLLGAWALNHIGGGPEQEFVGPVTDLVKEKSGTRFAYRVEVIGPDGSPHEISLASRVSTKEQPEWDDFAGFRRGDCARLSWRIGSLGQMIYGNSAPVPCPPTHGEPPPDGTGRVAVDLVDGRVAHWEWRWLDAGEGSEFEAWYQDLLVVARRHQPDLSGQTIGLVARIAPDGRIMEARVSEPRLPSEIANAMAATLVGRRDVLVRPDLDGPDGQPIWARVPLRLTVE